MRREQTIMQILIGLGNKFTLKWIRSKLLDFNEPIENNDSFLLALMNCLEIINPIIIIINLTTFKCRHAIRLITVDSIT